MGDSPKSVQKNREIAAAALGYKAVNLTCAQQVHGCSTARVNKDSVGAGSFAYEEAIAGIDALLTIEQQAPLAIFIADCVPVILVEPERRVVAVVHAGWRGTLARIAAAAVEKIKTEFGVAADKLLAYLGPAIRACSYRVDDRLHQRFRQSFPQVVGDELALDLSMVNNYQLLAAGLKVENVFDLGLCTFCRQDLFYSYRREQITGRQAAIAMVI